MIIDKSIAAENATLAYAILENRGSIINTVGRIAINGTIIMKEPSKLNKKKISAIIVA